MAHQYSRVGFSSSVEVNEVNLSLSYGGVLSIRPSTFDQVVSMWPVYLFACTMTEVVYTLWFSMVIVFICSNRGPSLNDFNFYVMGKKYMLSLLSTILVLCNRVESRKITSYFELFWTKYFHLSWQNVSTYFNRFVKTDWQIIHKFTKY